MYHRYHIPIKHVPGRYPNIGKYIVIRNDFCINCGQCEIACLYEVHKRREDDPRKMADPISENCVGCFRCVKTCPRNALSILDNEEYYKLGGGIWSPEIIKTIWYESETGRVPVSGAGYSGKFAGPDYDSLWTDMSEIVRPTRDGIHGREFISTAVFYGPRKLVLDFNNLDQILNDAVIPIEIQIPIILESPAFGPIDKKYMQILGQVAKDVETLVFVDIENVSEEMNQFLRNIILRISVEDLDSKVLEKVDCIEIKGSFKEIKQAVLRIKEKYTNKIISAYLPGALLDEDFDFSRLLELIDIGVHVFHVEVNRLNDKNTENKLHLMKVIRSIHMFLVEKSIRDKVIIVASGDIRLAEHMPKLIISGADIIALDVPILVALECSLCMDCIKNRKCKKEIEKIDPNWGVDRIKNLLASWRDQLLEILGAMGMREVRRLRGEVGRSISQEEEEKNFEEYIKGGLVK